MLCDLRQIAEGAKNDLPEGLGPESDLDIEDLNPKQFVRKHILDDPNADNGVQPQQVFGLPPPSRAYHNRQVTIGHEWRSDCGNKE